MHIDELLRPHRRCLSEAKRSAYHYFAHTADLSALSVDVMVSALKGTLHYRPSIDVPISLILVKTHYRLASAVGEMAKNNHGYDKSYFLLLSIARQAGIGQGR